MDKKDKELIEFATKIADIFRDSTTPISETIIAIGNRDKNVITSAVSAERERCVKKVKNDKLFNLWWDKMSKGGNKEQLMEKRLASNVWIAARVYFAKAIREKNLPVTKKPVTHKE